MKTNALPLFYPWLSLSVVLLFSLATTTVTYGFAGGDGSPEDPYQIATAEHLDAVRDHLDSHFVQTDDIDLTVAPWNEGEGWLPIGDSEFFFTGQYDGANYKIIGLFIDRPEENQVGLFGHIALDASLSRIHLMGAAVTGRDSVGTVAGRAEGLIYASHATGSVNGEVGVGGLVGECRNVIDSSAAVEVSGTSQVGGLAGLGGGIQGSMSSGPVTGMDKVGGLLGEQSLMVPITDSYATGSVDGENRVGGLIGFGVVEGPIRCYATGQVTASGSEAGGLGRWNTYGAIGQSCFWDIETSGMIGSTTGKGLTTAEMGTPSIFGNAGWAGHGWVMEPGEYPLREWEDTSAPPIPAAQAVPLAGSGTEGDPYQVSNAAELALLSWYEAILDAHILIVDSIDCDGVKMYPIGDLGQFRGVFDGGEHTISNMSMLYSESDHIGLIGNLINDGVVKNVHLAGAQVEGFRGTGAIVGYMQGENDFNGLIPALLENSSAAGEVRGSVNVGGLVGVIFLSKVTNCVSEVSVEGASSGAGGLAGFVTNGSIIDCSSNGDVSGNEKVGGLVGALWGMDLHLHLPDSSLKLGKIESCRVNANVFGQDDVGGLVGEQRGLSGAGGKGIIESSFSGVVSGAFRVGGLVGLNRDSSQIVDSWSSGLVEGEEDVGGLVGRHESGSEILRCYSVADVAGSDRFFMNHAYNGTNVGGLVGYQHLSFIRRSFARGNVVALEMGGGIVGVNHGDYLTRNSWVTDSYAMGRVRANSYAAGLAAYNNMGTIENSFVAGTLSGPVRAGVVSMEIFGVATDTYWNTDLSVNNSSGGSPRTTDDMTYPYDVNTYEGWDFETVWAADSDGLRNDGYPWLLGVTPPPVSLTLESIPSSYGSVSGDGVFPVGQRLEITATPADNHHFVGWEWEGNIISTDETVTFTALKDQDLIAHFAIDTFEISVESSADELGTVSGGGVFDHGSVITVSASPTEEGRFIHWEENENVVSTDADYSFTVENARSLVAIFGEPIVFGGGSGTEEDPYLLSSPTHLNNVRHISNAYYRMTGDIDLGVAPWNEGEGWEPIGSPESGWHYEESEVFTGRFDGDGYVIRNLTINRIADRQGLFGIVDGGEIRNVVIENVAIEGNDRVGALIGILMEGLVVNCHSSGTIDTPEWSGMIGGLVGNLWDYGVIESSSSSVAVSGYDYVGGLVGLAYGTIRRSWATGPVIGSYFAGGLVGELDGAFIEDCYATGSVTDPDGWGPIGALAGGAGWLDLPMMVRNSYATGQVIMERNGEGGEGEWGGGAGGLFGVWGNEYDDPEWIEAEWENCYWDVQTTGQTSSPAGEGRTTAEMTYPHDPDTYLWWDFEEVWTADTDGTINNGYPFLGEMETTPPSSYTLVYLAGAGGLISGESTQTVVHGGDGLEVYAEADDGAVFDSWSDGVLTALRTDTNVQEDLVVTANFSSVGGVEIDWYVAHGFALEGPQTWADLDDIDLTGKGLTLRQEFIAGTDPTDPQSRFVAESPLMEETGFEIHFAPSLPERRYSLLRSTDLENWNPVLGMQNVPGGNGPMVDSDPPEGSAFYRIEVSLP